MNKMEKANDRYGLLGVFILALGVRLLFVREWLNSIYSTTPFLDAMAYHQWAERIADGEWFAKNAFYQNPLYPYVLAVVYKFVGPNPSVVSWLQAILGALTCVILADATRRFFNSRSGLIAGGLAALYPTSIYFAGPLLKETLGLFTLSLFLWQFSWAWAFGAGVALGFSALVRSNVLLLPLALAPWALKQRRAFAALLCGLVFVLIPSTVHNFHVSNDFVLINSAGGFNFYVGNSPSGLKLEYPSGVSTDPAFEERDAKALAESEVGRPLKPSEVSSHWFNKGLQFIREEPQAAFWHTLNKILIFWNGREIGDNYDLEFYKAEFPSVLNFMPVRFFLLSFLAALGWVLSRGTVHIKSANFIAGCAGVYFLSVILFYVNDRYRLPVVMFLFPLAGFAIDRIWSGAAFRREGLVAFAFALPFLIVGIYPMGTHQDRLLAFNYGLLAGLYSDVGQDEKALEAYEKSLKANARLTPAFAHIKASTSLERKGLLKEAEAALALSVEVHSDGFSLFNHGRFKFEHGDPAGAEALYKKAIEVAPHLYQPYLGLSLLYLKADDKKRACTAVEAGLRLQPNDENLLKVLRMCD